jgi:hypothetical protein
MHVLRPQFPIARRNNFRLHSEWEICSISLESNFLDDLGESLAANRFIALNFFKRMMTHARVAFQLSNSRLKIVSLGRVLIAAHLFFSYNFGARLGGGKYYSIVRFFRGLSTSNPEQYCIRADGHLQQSQRSGVHRLSSARLLRYFSRRFCPQSASGHGDL